MLKMAAPKDGLLNGNCIPNSLVPKHKATLASSDPSLTAMILGNASASNPSLTMATLFYPTRFAIP